MSLASLRSERELAEWLGEALTRCSCFELRRGDDARPLGVCVLRVASFTAERRHDFAAQTFVFVDRSKLLRDSTFYTVVALVDEYATARESYVRLDSALGAKRT